MKNNKPHLYTASQQPAKWMRLHDMKIDPRGFRVSPKKAAAIRRAQLEAIQEMEQAFINVEATLRRAYLYQASLPHVQLRAAERRAELDALAEQAQNYGHPSLKGR